MRERRERERGIRCHSPYGCHISCGEKSELFASNTFWTKGKTDFGAINASPPERRKIPNHFLAIKDGASSHAKKCRETANCQWTCSQDDPQNEYKPASVLLVSRHTFHSLHSANLYLESSSRICLTLKLPNNKSKDSRTFFIITHHSCHPYCYRKRFHLYF